MRDGRPTGVMYTQILMRTPTIMSSRRLCKLNCAVVCPSTACQIARSGRGRFNTGWLRLTFLAAPDKIHTKRLVENYIFRDSIYIYSFIVGCQTQPNKRTWVNSKYIQRAIVSWTWGRSTKCYIAYNTKEYILHKIWEYSFGSDRLSSIIRWIISIDSSDSKSNYKPEPRGRGPPIHENSISKCWKQWQPENDMSIVVHLGPYRLPIGATTIGTGGDWSPQLLG